MHITTAEFIKKATTIHKNIYDYSLVDYKNNTTKITIICKDHGEFKQTPLCHTINKTGCPIKELGYNLIIMWEDEFK